MVQHRTHYPYQHGIAWHHPADHRLLMQSGWAAEIMLNLSQPDAMNFLEALIVDWLQIHPFAGLPNNGGQLKTIDRRRGYVLWMMAMDFEQCALPTSNDRGGLAEQYRAQPREPLPATPCLTGSAADYIGFCGVTRRIERTVLSKSLRSSIRNPACIQ
jgi:hypothetical protein